MREWDSNPWKSFSSRSPNVSSFAKTREDFFSSKQLRLIENLQVIISYNTQIMTLFLSFDSISLYYYRKTKCVTREASGIIKRLRRPAHHSIYASTKFNRADERISGRNVYVFLDSQLRKEIFTSDGLRTVCLPLNIRFCEQTVEYI